jgi:Tol biopolymer transport system component
MVIRVSRTSHWLIISLVIGVISIGLLVILWRAHSPSTGSLVLRGVETGLSVSQDGSTIAFSALDHGTRRLFRLDAESRQVTSLFDTPRAAAWPAFSASGESIVYAMRASKGSGSDIWVMDTNTGVSRQLTDASTMDTAPCCDPNNQTVVFARAVLHRPYSMGGFVWDQWDLYRVTLDGSPEEQLTRNGFASLGRPSIAAGSGLITFAADDGTGSSIYILNLHGPSGLPIVLGPKDIVHGMPQSRNETDPVFSPDGKDILFVSDAVSRTSVFDYELWRMKAGGARSMQLSRERAFNAQPQWMPDGKRVVYLSDQERDGRFDLHILDIQTGDIHTIYFKGGDGR